MWGQSGTKWLYWGIKWSSGLLSLSKLISQKKLIAQSFISNISLLTHHLITEFHNFYSELIKNVRSFETGSSANVFIFVCDVCCAVIEQVYTLSSLPSKCLVVSDWTYIANEHLSGAMSHEYTSRQLTISPMAYLIFTALIN